MKLGYYKRLKRAVREYTKKRKIGISLEIVANYATFCEATEENKWQVVYILSDGTSMETMSEEYRDKLSEYAAIIEISKRFFVVVYIHN